MSVEMEDVTVGTLDPCSEHKDCRDAVKDGKPELASYCAGRQQR